MEAHSGFYQEHGKILNEGIRDILENITRQIRQTRLSLKVGAIGEQSYGRWYQDVQPIKI